jgi:hypothetical protein
MTAARPRESRGGSEAVATGGKLASADDCIRISAAGCAAIALATEEPCGSVEAGC